MSLMLDFFEYIVCDSQITYHINETIETAI